MEKYEPIGLIGKGNFGAITKIRRVADGKILVWKEMNYGRMDEKERHHIVSEVNILRELHHPNIVKYYDRILDKKHTKIYIIMEYCPGGDLAQLIKRCKKAKEYIAEDIIWKIFSQVVLALYACHNFKEGKILHRDIKPSNVFLDEDNNVKLGDFGLSRVLSNESNFAYSNVGTPYYMSPEQIDENRYNEKSDIWSLGCFLYELTCLRPPFEATNHLSLALKIKAGKVERIPNKYSDELSRVISCMMTVNQNNRPTIEDIINIPQVSMKIRERKIKENYTKLKLLEENVKQREMKVKEKEIELKLREEYLNERERILNERENKFNREVHNLNIKHNKENSSHKNNSASSLLQQNIDFTNYDVSINSNLINSDLYKDIDNYNENENEVDNSAMDSINYPSRPKTYKQTPPISKTNEIYHKSVNISNASFNSNPNNNNSNINTVYHSHQKNKSFHFNSIISSQSTSIENSNNNNFYSNHINGSIQNEYRLTNKTINNNLNSNNNTISMHSFAMTNNNNSIDLSKENDNNYYMRKMTIDYPNHSYNNMNVKNKNINENNMSIYTPATQRSKISTPKRTFGRVMLTPCHKRYSPIRRGTPRIQQSNIAQSPMIQRNNNSNNIEQMNLISTNYKKKNSYRNNSSSNRRTNYEKFI